MTQRFTKSNHWFLQISSLRIDREQHVPDSSNHSLCLMKLLNFSSPGGNCGGTSCEMVRLVFRPSPEYNERQYRHEPPPAFALLKPRSPSFKSLLKPLSRSRNICLGHGTLQRAQTKAATIRLLLCEGREGWVIRMLRTPISLRHKPVPPPSVPTPCRKRMGLLTVRT